MSAEVEKAYREDLAWQCRRQRALNDRQERLLDRQEEEWKGILKEAAGILSGFDKVRLERVLAQQFDAERRET